MPPKIKMTPEQVVEDLQRREVSINNEVERETHASRNRKVDGYIEEALKPFKVVKWPWVHSRNKLHPPV